ncbi:MAG TPA: Imm30 family immunity protein [Thermoanaerobaculia bacterium]|nr:Imm30 family immunity protein [Thermoanaerobaculia bacterium]
MHELERANDKGDAQYVQKFEDVLARIAAEADPDSIESLLAFFEEKPLYDEPMFSIVHTIEAFDDNTYVDRMVVGMPSLSARSPRWASILQMRIMNSEPTYAAYLGRLANATPEECSAAARVASAVAAKQPRFGSRVQMLLDVCGAEPRR